MAVGGLEMLVAQAVCAAEYFLSRKYDDATGEIGRITAALRRVMLNVSLIGMPSSGKSTVGRALPEKLGKKFIDLDEEIVQADGRSIPDIFAAEGEDGFRAKESDVYKRQLQKRVRAVYRRLGLPLRTAYNKDKVYAEMLHDKKAQGGQITVIKVRCV